MQWMEKRLTVLVGNYGSGKTEIALNAALNIREAGGPVALVDLDIVNPYFRSAEQAQMLKKKGIRVLMPTFAMSTMDIPALPAEIQSVFDQPGERVVFDVGGDDTGAAALGRYAPFFQTERSETRTLLVVNCLRPLTQTPEDILDLMERIAGRSRLALNGLVNNTNLAGLTTIQQVLDGQEVLERVSRQSGVPIVMVTGTQELVSGLPREMKAIAFPIRRYMKPEWMEA